MKQKDIVTIVFAAGIGAIVAFILAQLFISTPANRRQRVEIIDPVPNRLVWDENLDLYVNENSTNPTATIRIGGNPSNNVNQQIER